MENSMEVPQKTKNKTTILSSNATPGYIFKEHKNTNSKRYMHPNVHRGIIYNSKICNHQFHDYYGLVYHSIPIWLDWLLPRISRSGSLSKSLIEELVNSLIPLAIVDTAFTIVANSFLILSCHCSVTHPSQNQLHLWTWKEYLLASNFVWVILRTVQLLVKAVAFFSAGKLIDVISNNSWVTQRAFTLVALSWILLTSVWKVPWKEKLVKHW